MQSRLLKKFSFFKKTSHSKTLGIYICADNIWVYCTKTAKKPASVSTFPLKAGNWDKVFKAISKKYASASAQIVLSPEYYQLLLVDKPNVPAEEMSQALTWSVKDLVAQPITDIQLDYFESSQQGATKINVVVAEKNALQGMVLAAKEHHVAIEGISIEEMVLTNLFEDDLARMVLCHPVGQELVLTVVKNDVLYLHRRVRGFANIDKVPAEEMAGVADNLSLEIQRSMDYFESQFRQAPVNSIELLVNGEAELLAQLVSANFNQEVNYLQSESVEAQIALLAVNELNREVGP